MSRGTFWLLAPVVLSAAIIFVAHNADVQRADYFFFQVMGLAVAFWIVIGIGRMIIARRRK